MAHLKRLLALPLATLLVVLGLAVPLLDAGLSDAGPVLETEHHAACVVGHDHTICTQAGSNLALATVVSGAERPEACASALRRRPVLAPTTGSALTGPPPRAPPVARA